MFDALLSGKLLRDPENRTTGQSDKLFTTALLMVPTESEDNLLVSLIESHVG